MILLLALEEAKPEKDANHPRVSDLLTAQGSELQEITRPALIMLDSRVHKTGFRSP